jgi:hypothetical protein
MEGCIQNDGIVQSGYSGLKERSIPRGPRSGWYGNWRQDRFRQQRREGYGYYCRGNTGSFVPREPRAMRLRSNVQVNICPEVGCAPREPRAMRTQQSNRMGIRGDGIGRRWVQERGEVGDVAKHKVCGLCSEYGSRS